MTPTAVPASIRVTLQSAGHRHDVVVDPRAPLGDTVRRVYGDVPGPGPAVTTRTGRVLDPSLRPADLDVADGDVLVVAESSVPTRRRRPGRSRARDVPSGRGRLVVVGSGAMALCGAGLVAQGLLEGGYRAAVGVVVALVGAALAMVPNRSGIGDLARGAAPAVGAVGVLALVVGPGPGRTLLGWVAAGLTAAVLAAAVHARGAAPAAVNRVWMVAGAASAVVAAVVLLQGWREVVVGAVAAAAVLPVVRLLPTVLVDVPDDVLLELDRLSVTAWAVHPGQRRPARQRPAVHEVVSMVRQGQALAVAGTVAAAVTGALAAVGLLVLPTAPGPASAAGTAVLLGCLAVGQALVARGIRQRWSRAALRGSAAVAATCLAVVLVPTVPGSVLLPVAVVGVVVATAVAGAAVALGRGWRSVRWARLADGVEALAVAGSLPAGLVAAGVVDLVRQVMA